jgi:hypothetical protein
MGIMLDGEEGVVPYRLKYTPSWEVSQPVISKEGVG